MIDGIIYNRFNFIINNVGYNNSNMEKLSSIIHKSALETYDLVEKNKTLIVQLITMFLPKETRDFILNKDFEFNTYYSKSELEAMDIENQGKSSKKKRKNKNKNIKQKKHKKPVGLLNSINKSKLHFLLQYIPNSLLNFIIFFTYSTLHSIHFFTVIIVLLLVSNIYFLLIALFLLVINTISIVIFTNCPIHIIEQKYRNKLTHNQHFLCNIIKKIYDENVKNTYENSIEHLICAIFIILLKINLLILYKCFCK
jgi:hypothetical protein